MVSAYSFENLIHLYGLDESSGSKKLGEARKIYNRVYKSKRSSGMDGSIAALAAYNIAEEQIKPIVNPIDQKIEMFIEMKGEGIDILKIMEKLRNQYPSE